MSQPPTGPEGFPPATPTPPAGSPDPDATVQHAAGNDPTVRYPAGQPAQQQYAPGQPTPPQQYAPGQPASQQQYAPGQPAPQQQYAPGQAAPQYGTPQTPGYPASAPPYAGQPMSAPPVSGPAYGQPMSAPPVSGPAYGQPMSAPPVSGPAYGQPMSGPPGMAPYGAPAAPRRGRAVLVLALVAALLFVVSGVMTGLFVTKNNELNRTEKRLTGQVSQRDGTIAANTTEIAKLKTDLQTMQDKLDNTEQDLTGTRNDRDEQARQKKVIASCLDKLTTALGAAAAGNKGAYDAAMKGLDKVCDEAENYL
ncbi:hypothetical protein [Micromonospora sp. MH99]|uniref:hypothetical protein n=1 Tax=Micromonospora sp. MH99 TaxID=1945510 RepID=UPI001F1EE1D1|nr:hypothetical protein [Micromonospora sp. MH99]MCF0097453.1 hypothetical protein [Micromonospora sp. MH99]